MHLHFGSSKRIFFDEVDVLHSLDIKYGIIVFAKKFNNHLRCELGRKVKICDDNYFCFRLAFLFLLMMNLIHEQKNVAKKAFHQRTINRLHKDKVIISFLFLDGDDGRY